jgi:hypothetical protein
MQQHETYWVDPVPGLHLTPTSAHAVRASWLLLFQGGSSIGLRAPYPLVVFTGGFVVGSTAYRETAAHLASWG